MTSHNIISLDIETAPDYDAVRKYNSFDESTVTMRVKDKGKESARIAEVRKEFWDKLDDKAALQPLTSQIIAVGLIDDNGPKTYTGEEGYLINIIFTLYLKIKQGDMPVSFMCGWNIFGFDLPRLIQRARMVGLKVPPGIRNGRYYDKIFVDLMKEWTCDEYGKYMKLETMAKALGVSRPREHNIKGKDFHLVLKEDPESALKYLEDDLYETHAIAHRLLNN